MYRTALLVALLSVASPLGFAKDFCGAHEQRLFACRSEMRTIAVCAASDDASMLTVHIVEPRRSTVVAAEGPFSSRTVVVTGKAWVPNGPPGTYVTLRYFTRAYTIYATGSRGAQYGDDAGLLIENQDRVEARYACDDGARYFDQAVLSRLNAGRVIQGKDKSIPF